MQHELRERKLPHPDSLICGRRGSIHQQSGKPRCWFRLGLRQQLRDAVCDFAGDSHQANPWAADLDRRAAVGRSRADLAASGVKDQRVAVRASRPGGSTS
jgi:hypothetical protein